MMRFALLALLSTGPSYGYELKQALDARFAAVWPQINIGQIYTTLQRLERDGLAESLEVVAEERNKRSYRITAGGREALAAWMADPSGGTARLKDEFFTKLVLAEATGAGDPLPLIERQRARYLQSLRDLNDLATANGHDRTTRLLIEGTSLHLQADLRWLDLCEEQLNSGDK